MSDTSPAASEASSTPTEPSTRKLSQTRRSLSQRLGPSRAVWLIVLLAVAVALRSNSLGRVPMWVDEAESSINALTILQRGIPTGYYLGMPVYENTHLVPWTENREYRFKDVSYSPRGYAVYHGWVPLYAIAAALGMADIRPDDETAGPAVVHTAEERHRRTIVPRIPAVIFGVAAVLVFYLLGTTLYGPDAGMAAAIITTLSPMHIYVSQQARYFSATVLFCGVCLYAAWQMVFRQRWRDFVIGGVSFAILFHTHLLTFLISSFMFAGLLGAALLVQKRSFAWWRAAAAACIMATVILPWIAATQLLESVSRIPPAWRLMELPEDLLLYRMLMPPYRFAGLVVLCTCGWALVRYGNVDLTRWTKPVRRYGMCLGFLTGWILAGYLGFTFLIPAASYAVARLMVLLLAPATVLIACICAALARTRWTGRPVLAASLLAILPAVAAHRFWPATPDSVAASQHADVDAAVSYLAIAAKLPFTRLYANPNDHLLLTYYSGLPVQSIAAVREEFLNRYPGNVVVLLRQDFFVRDGDPIDADHLEQAAKKAGVLLSGTDARVLSYDLATLSERTRTARRVTAVTPPVVDPPVFAAAAYADWQKVRNERQREYASRWIRFPMFRGFDIRTIDDWWTVFFFRFSNPHAELAEPNYRSRLKNALATPLRGSNWMAYHSKGI